MTDDFAKKVYPPIIAVLDLLERLPVGGEVGPGGTIVDSGQVADLGGDTALETPAEEPEGVPYINFEQTLLGGMFEKPAPKTPLPKASAKPSRAREDSSIQSARIALKGLLGALSSGSGEEQLAYRALIYWIDERFIGSAWGSYWTKHPLEHELLGSRNRAEQFFADAAAASAMATTNALQTFYLCAALQFVGVHRTQQRAVDQEKTGSAAGDLGRWAKKTYARIAAEQRSRYQPASPPEAVGECRPLRSAMLLAGLVKSLIVLVIVAAILGAMLWA